jgi:hypothetical protein
MKTPQDMDKPFIEIPKQRRNNRLNSFFAGAGTTVAVLALGVGGFLFYQAMEFGQVRNPFNLPATKSRTPIPTPPPATVASPSPGAGLGVPVPPNPYLQPALANKAQIELVSVKRIPGTPDEVNVEMRINRVGENAIASDTINIGTTTGRNPVTNETYKSVAPLKRSSGTVSLFNMRQGQPADAYVVLKVPQGVTLIDIFVENTGTFKNVLVADADQGWSGLSPLPTAVPTPGASTNPFTPFGKTPPITETIPIPGTKTPVLPTPGLATPTPKSSGVTPLPSPGAREEKKGQNSDPDKSVQKAFGNQAQVQLVSVQRVVNPQTGKGDFVNVQLRIRRLADEVNAKNAINVGRITARNSVSNTVYNAVESPGAISSIALNSIPKGESVNAAIALKIPPGVQVVDIYVPETGTFEQVQISRPSPID